MKEVILEVLENKKLNNDVYKLTLKGDVSGVTNTGQFVEVALKNHYLRRPFSVADYSSEYLTILYKILGLGTEEMTTLVPGDTLEVLTGLGNGFDIYKSNKPLLVGGGIGTAPLYNLAKKFSQRGIRPTIVLGFKNKDEIFYLDEFSKLGEVIVTTDDGSFGTKGNACTYLSERNVNFDYYYACGPMVMLKNLAKNYQNGEVSLEARMGCGFGACMGCSIKTTKGPKRVCKEGPVFPADEVIF